MGQTITTLFCRWLDRESGKSLLSADHHGHGDGDEGTGSVWLFGRCWKMGKSLISFFKWLMGRGPAKPPSNPLPRYPDDDVECSHVIDIGIDIPGGDHEEADRTVGGNFGSPVRQVSIGLVDVDIPDAEGVIVKQLPPAAAPPSPPPPPISKRQGRGRLGPYSWEQKILLVGEGDFSFSASLAVAFGDASNIIATSFDSFEFLMENYGRAESNISELRSKGCKVMHGVDATIMAKHPKFLRSLKFDCIVYNFPHAGFANRDAPRDAQISKHQALVRGFLANAKKMIKDEGQIHITHKSVGFSREWNLEMLGAKEGLRLVEEAPFNYRDYPGYNTKYGYGGDRNFDCRPSKRYKFQLGSPQSPTPKKKRTARRKQNN